MSDRWALTLGMLLALVVIGSGGASAQSLGTGFTYQGQLLLEGEPVDATCDLVFNLYEDETGGTAIEGPVVETGITVRDGRFTTVLDFGSNVFTGFARWIDIAVRCPTGSGLYTTLEPRQRITAVPYAFSAKATLKTLTLGPHSFLPSDGSDPKFIGGWLTPWSQNSVTWVTELKLPDNSTVRRIRCRWFDESTFPEDQNAGIMSLRLRRLKVEEYPANYATGDVMAEAEVDTTGFRGTKTTALAADDISHEVVDTDRYVYHLGFSFRLHPSNTWEETVHFGGCHVDYLTASIP